MGFFITVTYDLNQAPSSIYPRVQSDLEAIDFSRVVTGKKSFETSLPANTFVAKFDNDDFDHSSDACAYVRDELKRIFNKYKINGRYFVAAGQKWAYKTGTF